MTHAAAPRRIDVVEKGAVIPAQIPRAVILTSARRPRLYLTTSRRPDGTVLTYDTFGRLQRLTYPDGEVLTYGYGAGGNLSTAAGLKNGYAYNYLKRLEKTPGIRYVRTTRLPRGRQ